MAALAVWGLVAVQLVAVHPVVTVAAVHPVVVHPVAGNDPLPQDGLASKTKLAKPPSTHRERLSGADVAAVSPVILDGKKPHELSVVSQDRAQVCAYRRRVANP